MAGLFKNKDYFVRMSVAFALGNIGPAAVDPKARAARHPCQPGQASGTALPG